MDNYLDSLGCSPQCAPHQTFGIELCDIVQCRACDAPNQIRDVSPPIYMHQLYVLEILGLQESAPEVYSTLPEIIKEIITNDNDFHFKRW